MQKLCLRPIKSSTTITLLHLSQVENLKFCKSSQHNLHSRKILQHKDSEMCHLASEQVQAASFILELHSSHRDVPTFPYHYIGRLLRHTTLSLLMS